MGLMGMLCGYGKNLRKSIMEIPSLGWGFYGVWSYGYYPFEGPLYWVVHMHLRFPGPFRMGCSHAYMFSRIIEN